MYIVYSNCNENYMKSSNECITLDMHVLSICQFCNWCYNSHRYQLLAVIEHLGGPASGHYCTYRRHNGQWIYTSDLTVYPVYISEVLNAQAYMLFYQKM